MTSRNDEFNDLLQASSLGTDAARRLRERTPATTANAIRTITHLRNLLVHAPGTTGARQAASEIFTALDALTSDDTGLKALYAAVEQVRTNDGIQATEALTNALEALSLLRWNEVDDTTTQELQQALAHAVTHLASEAASRRTAEATPEPQPPRNRKPETAQCQPEASPRHSRDGITYLTVAEVAAVMAVSKMTVYRLVHSGHLPTISVGRSWRIPEDAVHEYLRETYVETRSNPHRP